MSGKEGSAGSVHLLRRVGPQALLVFMPTNQSLSNTKVLSLFLCFRLITAKTVVDLVLEVIIVYRDWASRVR
jgi:hypothetical protein